MKPDEFLDLQAREFYLLLDGYQDEEKRRDQKTAYFLSWLINTQVTRNISVGDILEPLYPGTRAEEEAANDYKRQTDEQVLKEEFGLG